MWRQSSCLLSIRTLAAAEILPVAIQETRSLAIRCAPTNTQFSNVANFNWLSPCLPSVPIHHHVLLWIPPVKAFQFYHLKCQWRAGAICWKWDNFFNLFDSNSFWNCLQTTFSRSHRVMKQMWNHLFGDLLFRNCQQHHFPHYHQT